ncbi:MAG: radical SAM protein [Desulfobulbaceae bacterium]|nr:radical SAM protein [Desulfobulbaceae bacterium]
MNMLLVIPIFIPHRGCPHDCLFCNQQKISGYDRDNTVQVAVAETIDQWLERNKSRRQVQVAFFGGSFTCLSAREQKNLLSAVQPYLEKGKVDTIRLSTRPDCIDPAVCELLKEYKVGVVELGAQSLSDKVLQKSLRGHTSEHVRNGFRLLKASGMQVGLQLMPGLPGESSASFLHGIDEVITLKPDFVRLYPALVVKESGLEKLYRLKQYQPLSLGKAIALTAKCYQKLTEAGIGVVRMGLQPSEALEESVVAGPYHPAFGELVQSRIWLKKIRTRLVLLGPQQKLHIHVSHRDISAVVGMKKRNTIRLEELGFSGRYKILPDKNMARGSIHYAVC